MSKKAFVGAIIITSALYLTNSAFTNATQDENLIYYSKEQLNYSIKLKLDKKTYGLEPININISACCDADLNIQIKYNLNGKWIVFKEFNYFIKGLNEIYEYTPNQTGRYKVYAKLLDCGKRMAWSSKEFIAW